MTAALSGALLAVILSVAPPPDTVQGRSVSDPVMEAQRLRETGEFAAAAKLLREELKTHPDNGDAARMLAQTLYWMQDVTGAREVYETALTRHPQDTTLRLQYARMLAETGQRSRARELLLALRNVTAARAEASTILGTLAYWEGNLSAAKRLFEAALESDPTQREARRQLDEIQTVTAPSIRVSTEIGADDQPLDRLAFGVQGRWFATPLVPVTVRVDPRAFRPEGELTRRFWEAEARVAHFAPSLRLESEIAAGLIHRSNQPHTMDWTGRVTLGVRLPQHVTAHFRADRTPYLYTVASLDTPIMVRTAKGWISWQNPRGWLAEAAYQQQRFPDGNNIRAAYAWQLVPLVHRDPGELQVGYAFAAENSDELRFVPDSGARRARPGNGVSVTSGHYDPYYTPSNVVTHSLIAAMMLRPSRRAVLRAGGSYALHATENAPGFVLSAGRPQLTIESRSFTPWNVRTSVETQVTGGVILSANAELGRTAFYKWSAGGLQITFRLRKAR